MLSEVGSVIRTDYLYIIFDIYYSLKELAYAQCDKNIKKGERGRERISIRRAFCLKLEISFPFSRW